MAEPKTMKTYALLIVLAVTRLIAAEKNSVSRYLYSRQQRPTTASCARISNDENLQCSELQTMNENVGTICTKIIQGHLQVTYETKDDWVLMDTHLWVGSILTDMPQNRNRIPRYTLFPNNDSNLLSTTHSYSIPLTDELFDCPSENAELVIASHASVFEESSFGKTLSAWGAGENFAEIPKWGTYSLLDLSCGPCGSQATISECPAIVNANQRGFKCRRINSVDLSLGTLCMGILTNDSSLGVPEYNFEIKFRSVDSWILDDVHMWVGPLNQLPRTRLGSPILAHFPYRDSNLDATVHTYTVPLTSTSFECPSIDDYDIILAARASFYQKDSVTGTIIQRASGWGTGTAFVADQAMEGTYSPFTLTCNSCVAGTQNLSPAPAPSNEERYFDQTPTSEPSPRQWQPTSEPSTFILNDDAIISENDDYIMDDIMNFQDDDLNSQESECPVVVNSVNANTTIQCNWMRARLNNRIANVGNVCVEVASDSTSGEFIILVSYTTIDDWYLDATHLWVGSSLQHMPQNQDGIPRPAHFPHKDSSGLSSKTHSYNVQMPAQFTCPSESLRMMTAAHATVYERRQGGLNGIHVWSGGNKFYLRPQHGTYSEFELSCTACDTNLTDDIFLKNDDNQGETASDDDFFTNSFVDDNVQYTNGYPTSEPTYYYRPPNMAPIAKATTPSPTKRPGTKRPAASAPTLAPRINKNNENKAKMNGKASDDDDDDDDDDDHSTSNGGNGKNKNGKRQNKTEDNRDKTDIGNKKKPKKRRIFRG